MQSVNWAWGLSLIALTIAIHAMGVVMMAIAGLGIRARLEIRNLGLRHVILIVRSDCCWQVYWPVLSDLLLTRRHRRR